MFNKIFLNIFILFLSLFYHIHAEDLQLQGSTKGFPKPAPEVKGLITDEGKEFLFSNYKGKILLVSYGYTSCPHVCPTILAHLKQIEEKLNKEGFKGKYKIIFISVDPKNDTQGKVREFKKERKLEDFIFVLGFEDRLKKMWKKMNVFVEDKGFMIMKHNGKTMKHRMINHTAKLTIIDKKGNIREEFYSMYLPVDKIVEDVIKLTKE